MAKEPKPIGINNSMRRWLDDQEEEGWVMPRAVWWKRLPLIRNVRSLRFHLLIHRLAWEYGKVGIGLGTPNQRDKWIVYGIAQGKERPYD